MKCKSIKDFLLAPFSLVNRKPLTLAMVLTFSITGGNFASAALPLTPSLYAAPTTAPSGAIWLPDNSPFGGHIWISDHLQGFCRLDPNTDGTANINAATCYNFGIGGAAGQVAYDPTRNFIYLPDLSKKGSAITRLAYDTSSPEGGQIFVDGIIDQAIDRPTSVALGPDGALYVTNRKDGNIVRIVNPWSDDTTNPNFLLKQYKQSAGQTSDNRRALSIATVGDKLYIAETNLLTRISNIFNVTTPATSTSAAQYQCTGGCKAVNLGLNIIQPQSLYYDSQRLWAVDTTNTLYRLTPTLTGFFSSVIYAKTNLSFPSAVAARLPTTVGGSLVNGYVVVGDDPTGGVQVNQGRWWITPYE